MHFLTRRIRTFNFGVFTSGKHFCFFFCKKEFWNVHVTIINFKLFISTFFVLYTFHINIQYSHNTLSNNLLKLAPIFVHWLDILIHLKSNLYEKMSIKYFQKTKLIKKNPPIPSIYPNVRNSMNLWRKVHNEYIVWKLRFIYRFFMALFPNASLSIARVFFPSNALVLLSTIYTDIQKVQWPVLQIIIISRLSLI